MKVLVTQKTAGCNEKVEPKKLAACVLRRVSENGTLAVGRALEHFAPSGHAASPPFYPTASSLLMPSPKSIRKRTGRNDSIRLTGKCTASRYQLLHSGPRLRSLDSHQLYRSDSFLYSTP